MPRKGDEGKGGKFSLMEAKKHDHPRRRIMRAVAALIKKKGKNILSRKEIRDQIGVNHKKWMSGYVSIFQGMRIDHPGGAPDIGKRFKNVFRQVEHGRYTLTEYGKQILKEFDR